MRLNQPDSGHRELDLARQEVAQSLRAALIWHVRGLDPGQLIENHRREMGAGASAGRKIIELTRVRLGERDEFLDRLGGQRGMDDKCQWRGGHQRDRREIAHEVVRRFGEQAHVDRLCRDRRHQERIAVGRRLGDEFRADIAARAEAVVDDDLLAPGFAHFLADDAPDDIECAACRKRHHETH